MPLVINYKPCVIDYNCKNCKSQTNRVVQNLIQAFVIDYKPFVIDYKGKRNNRKMIRGKTQNLKYGHYINGAMDNAI